MKFFLLLLISVCSYLSAVCQVSGKLVKGRDYKGVIFSPDFKLRPDGTVKRWQPTEEDIKMLEQNLSAYMRKKGKSQLVNQGNGCPIISKNLSKYIRQYAGYINSAGKKIIYINCFWETDKEDTFTRDWENSLIQVLDGCSYFWQIHYDVNNKDFSGLIINGVA